MKKLLMVLLLCIAYNVMVLCFLFEVDVSTKVGYAGEPFQIHKNTAYRTLYLHPGDFYDRSMKIVAGTHIQEKSFIWTSLGYVPKLLDQVKVTEVRVFWRLDFHLIHGWGMTEYLGRANPFYISQRIVPTEELVKQFPEKAMKISEDGVLVVNTSDDYVRFRYDDGMEEDIPWTWFEAKNESYTNDGWAIGNTFSVGQVICSTPDAKNHIYTPDKAVVAATSGPYIRLEGSTSGYNFAWFQECPKKE